VTGCTHRQTNFIIRDYELQKLAAYQPNKSGFENSLSDSNEMLWT